MTAKPERHTINRVIAKPTIGSIPWLEAQEEKRRMQPPQEETAPRIPWEVERLRAENATLIKERDAALAKAVPGPSVRQLVDMVKAELGAPDADYASFKQRLRGACETAADANEDEILAACAFLLREHKRLIVVRAAVENK